MSEAEDIAWAAGLFEGEGTVSGYVRSGRLSRAVQITVYEGAQRGKPMLLERFRQVVGVGSIVGPYRRRLYHWTTKRISSVELVSTLLWPDLSPERREQFGRAFRGSARWEEHAARLGTPAPRILEALDGHELAWAAGFFDGEGSIVATRHGTGPPCLYLAQASNIDRPSSSLIRLHAAVGGGGRITGPRYLRNDWSKRPQWRWEATSFESVQSVVAMLWAHLGQAKRSQAREAFIGYLARKRSRPPDFIYSTV